MTDTKDNATRSKAFTFHVDPGHGWLEVSRADLEALNLSPASFSRYSYLGKDGSMFLEEDGDFTTFADAYGRILLDWTIQHHGHDCFVRNLPRNVGPIHCVYGAGSTAWSS